jgi:polyisoprenoid-binding protein YceI
MMTILRLSLVVMLLFPVLLESQEKRDYRIDSAASKLEINVYKEGMFKAFGHDHLIAAKDISGEVRFSAQKIDESSVRLTIPTKTITVIDPGESEKDRQDVQATMRGEKVLDVGKYPEITFTSSSLTDVKKITDGWNVLVSGKLSLHGVENPVRLPLQVRMSNGQVRGQGELMLLQTDYGITPVKVGGGSVKVKDKLKISFTIVAK